DVASVVQGRTRGSIKPCVAPRPVRAAKGAWSSSEGRHDARGCYLAYSIVALFRHVDAAGVVHSHGEGKPEVRGAPSRIRAIARSAGKSGEGVRGIGRLGEALPLRQNDH